MSQALRTAESALALSGSLASIQCLKSCKSSFRVSTTRDKWNQIQRVWCGVCVCAWKAMLGSPGIEGAGARCCRRLRLVPAVQARTPGLCPSLRSWRHLWRGKV